jgi:Polyketide cyclase / dehydrase and lipid transport
VLVIEKGVFISRPQQQVFDFASNPANWAKYEGPVESAEWTSEGPPRVESTVHITGRLMGRKTESAAEITAWDPPVRYGRKALNMPFAAELTLDFESRANGTQVNLYWQGEFRGLLRIVEGLLGWQLGKAVDKDLSALKRVMEEDQA